MRYGTDRGADNSIVDELCRKQFDPGRSAIAVTLGLVSSPALCPIATPIEGWFEAKRAATRTARSNRERRGRLDILKIRDAGDVEQAVRAAIAAEQPLEIIGHGTKRQIGQPMATNAVLDLSPLNAITSYEPNELIITLQAGAPLADVMSLIDSKSQHFAFEPVDTAPLLGASGAGTIGGMIAAGLAGPRRVKAGGGARSSARRACGLRFRRQFQDRRQGGEERHRLRPLQAAGGLLGHARGHDRGDAEGDAEAGEPSARWCCAASTMSRPTGR